jgi:hypothetical protein
MSSEDKNTNLLYKSLNKSDKSGKFRNEMVNIKL